MPGPVNPYIAGNPVGSGPAFVGRDDVLRAVLRALADPACHGIVLYGQRRIGKSSILQHLQKWLPGAGGPRAIYFDLQDKAARAPGRIYADLATTIAAALGLPAPTPGSDPEAWFRDAWLPSVLDALPGGGPLAVLFDEFDVLADPKAQREASEAVFRSLRDLLDALAPRLRFVFVIGRNVEDLSYLAGPLFKSLPSKQVSLLDRAETVRVVLLSTRNGTLSWAAEAVEAAWTLSHGDPSLRQHRCRQPWEAAHYASPAPPAVRAAAVEAAVPATLDSSQNALEWLWGGLPPAARVVASALAKAGPGTISEEALQGVLRENGVRVLMRELRDAPKLLGQWDIVEPDGGGHRFRGELLRRWIVRYKPLGRVQQELDRIEPMAENLYRVAEGFFSAGQFEEALPPLRQALGFNPNHLRASEMLAEILLSQGALEEARKVLERLHESDPAAAWSRLVHVLLQQARATREGDEEGRLGLYAKVLGYDAGNVAAKEAERAVWLARGERHRSKGETREAVAAYGKARREDLVAVVVEGARRTSLASTETNLPPFLPGRPVPANRFIGRRVARERLARYIAQHGDSTVIIGEPRVGKTSLLAYLDSPRAARTPSAVPPAASSSPRPTASSSPAASTGPASGPMSSAPSSRPASSTPPPPPPRRPPRLPRRRLRDHRLRALPPPPGRGQSSPCRPHRRARLPRRAVHDRQPGLPRLPPLPPQDRRHGHDSR